MSLGDLEREVMTQLWESSAPLSVRQVHERLRERDLAYTTVMTVLDRLAKKRLVTRERDGRAWLYAPAQSRAQLTVSVMMDALADTPDQDAALAHFVGQLSPEALAAAIDAAAKSGSPDAAAKSGSPDAAAKSGSPEAAGKSGSPEAAGKSSSFKSG